MESSINMPAILIANIMGIIILFVIVVGNSWQTKQIFKENPSLKVMFCACFIACIADPICFWADGKPGILNFCLVYVCNACVFASIIVNSQMWIRLISGRIDVEVPRLHQRIIFGAGIIEVSLLIVNLFIPIIFYVDKYNVYHRSSGYFIYTSYYIVLLLYGLLFYIVKRYKSGKLKMFPVWAFMIPAVTGMVIQLLYYGVSTITPFVTVSLSCIFISLQNEFVFYDKLTGLYNRFFLDIFEEQLSKNSRQQYTIMMLDLNEFKKINDIYGHSMGDQALINTAHIFKSIVGERGQVIRYAGDEFIIILNTQEDKTIKNIIAQINQSLVDFSKREDIPYKLSASIGYSKIDDSEVARDEFMEEIDQLMYKEKHKYYQKSSKNDRRRG